MEVRSKRVMESLLWAVVALQLLFIPTAYWVLFGGGWNRFMDARGEGFLEVAAPTRLAVNQFKEIERLGDRVLFTELGYTATLPGRAMGVDWYSPDLAKHAAAFADDPAVWRTVVDNSGANYVIAARVGEYPATPVFCRA